MTAIIMSHCCVQVEEVFTVPIRDLVDPAKRSVMARHGMRTSHCFVDHSHVVSAQGSVKICPCSMLDRIASGD